MTGQEKQEAIERVKAILRSHGIEMSVGGCGCCESPWVSFEYNGEVILKGCEDAIFDTREV